MANKYIKELSALTQLASSYGIEIDTGSASGYATLETLLTYNSRYKLVPSVSSNDLILAIKTVDGNDASSTDAIPFKIGNTIRWCTSALSVTKADGTNWANLGSAELGTKEVDLFPYAVWNTNLSAVDVFWSRIPNGRLYSDFSATTTNERYAAINATAPAATDECVLLGRFAATLSLSATSYLWTVPTYTNINLIHEPIQSTRWLSWTPQKTGYSNDPTGGTGVYNYLIDKKILYFSYADTGNATSNLTTKTATLPMAAATVSGMTWNFTIRGFDNGALLTTPALGQISTGGSVLSFFKDMSGAAWTGSGNHRMPGGTLWYPIEN